MTNIFTIFFATFVLSTILFFIAIKILKKMQFGQIEREEGLSSHKIKQGTPTMAGIVFILVFIIAIIISYIKYNNDINIMFFIKFSILLILFGVVGLIDDLLKIIFKTSKGLNSILKFLFQVILSYISLVLCFNEVLTYGYFIIFVYIFIIVGTDNGVNFTDGVDGLCAFVTLIISFFYTYLCYINLPKVESIEILLSNRFFILTIINAMMIAMLISFIIFNHHPAKVFMGDTGSLFLGAYIAIMAIALNVHFYLPIFGIIYMLEVLSVIIQVAYFKMTKGKRFFKMAPIHHHFEKSGFTEWQVVIVFTLITGLGCILTGLIR